MLNPKPYTFAWQTFQNPVYLYRSALSEALACAEISDRCSLYMPLCIPLGCFRQLPFLRWPTRLTPYHNGALLAAAIDTLTLPMRLTGEFLRVQGMHACSWLGNPWRWRYSIVTMTMRSMVVWCVHINASEDATTSCFCHTSAACGFRGDGSFTSLILFCAP